MADIEGRGAVQQLLSVLREAVEGPSGTWTYFIDKKPDAGLLGALGTVSAHKAYGAGGDTPIPAHTHLIRFAMAASAAPIESDQTPVDWKESWRVKTVDDAAWKEL